MSNRGSMHYSERLQEADQAAAPDHPLHPSRADDGKAAPSIQTKNDSAAVMPLASPDATAARGQDRRVTVR